MIRALADKSLISTAPAYISDMLQPVSSLQRQSNLRSATNSELFVPRTRLRVGERAFSSTAPRLWNDLPTDIKRAATLLTFKKKLKTFLFSKHLSWFYCILSSPFSVSPQIRKKERKKSTEQSTECNGILANKSPFSYYVIMLASIYFTIYNYSRIFICLFTSKFGISYHLRHHELFLSAVHKNSDSDFAGSMERVWLLVTREPVTRVHEPSGKQHHLQWNLCAVNNK